MEEQTETTYMKLSILISCYNQEDFIAQAMSSFYEQDYENVEMVVLDDGSTDNSMKVIAQTASAAPFPVRFYTQLNHGASYTFSRLAQLAEGDCLLFIGGDDFVPPNCLKQRMNLLNSNENLCCAGGLGKFFVDGCIGDDIFDQNKMVALNKLSPGKMQDLMRRYNFTRDGMLIFSATIVRKNYFEVIGGFEKDMLCDDVVMFFKLLGYAQDVGAEFRVIPEQVFYYRQHERNTCKNHMAMWARFSELNRRFGFNSRRQASFTAYAAYMQSVRQTKRWWQKELAVKIWQDKAVNKFLTIGAICKDLFFPFFRRF